MERAEAEAIYEAGRERCVDLILKLEQRVSRLEEQIRADSANSSKPPSSDPPASRRRRKQEQSGVEGERRAGAQPGHPGAGRKLKSTKQIDEIVDHYPDACGGCGQRLGHDLHSCGRFGRHQITELPELAVTVTEHRTHRVRCPHCRAKTTATLPAELSGSAFGPRLGAALVCLSARNRVSRRDICELAGELFGAELCSGTVDAICQRASAALAGPHEQLVASVLSAEALNVDETGWQTAGEGRTLWTATTAAAAIFRVAGDRHRERLDELIGADYQGIVCSDRWWAYDHLDPECRQACWAHLKRDFTRHAEGLAEQKDFGEAGLQLTGRLFGAWHSFAEHGERRRLGREIEPIEAELRALCERAGRKSKRTRHHRRFANNLLKIWPALWTFARTEGVEPTNNAAERSLRGPVIHRKLSYGTRSEGGERLIERLLSASVTCRLQGRSLFGYLVGVLEASARGDPLPSLA